MRDRTSKTPKPNPKCDFKHLHYHTKPGMFLSNKSTVRLYLSYMLMHANMLRMLLLKD